MPQAPTTPHPSRVCLTSAFAFSQGQGGSALGGGGPCLERQRQSEQGSFRELAAPPRGLVITHSARDCYFSTPALQTRPPHSSEPLLESVSRAPSSTYTTVDKALCVCVCVCVCLSFLSKEPTWLGKLPKLKAKSGWLSRSRAGAEKEGVGRSKNNRSISGLLKAK